MAKKVNQPNNESGEIKKLLAGLYTAITKINATSMEEQKINRELLKTLALLNAGFTDSKEEAQKLLNHVDEHMVLSDAHAKKWAKSVGATDKQVGKILLKFRELEKLDQDSIDNADDYLELLNKQYDRIDDTVGLSEKLLSTHKDLSEAVRLSKNQFEQFGGSIVKAGDNLEKLIRNKVDLSGMFDDVMSSMQKADDLIGKIREDMSGIANNVGGSVFDVDLHFNPLTDDLEKEVSKMQKAIMDEKNARIDGLLEFFDKNKKMQSNMVRSLAASISGSSISFDVDTGSITDGTKVLEKGSAAYQKMIDKLDSIASKNNVTDKLKVDFQEIANLLSLSSNKTADQKKRLDDLLKPLGLSAKIMANQLDMRMTELDVMTHGLQLDNERYRRMTEYVNQLATAEGIVKKVAMGFDELNAILPTGISEFLGISKASSQMLDAHRRGVTAFADKIADGVDSASAMKSYFTELGPAISIALNPLTIIVTTSILLLKFVESITDQYKEMASSMKISLIQSKQLLDVQLDTLTSQKNQFGTMQDIKDIQTSMIASTGMVSDLNNKSAKELTIGLIETGKAFGYGSEQAVKLQKAFNAIGADDKLALTLQQSVGYMSEMAGLSPQIIADDLVDSAETVATYFAGMPDQAAKAVIQVRRMGMSLKQAGTIAQKMLTMDDFMTNMYELQAMSGGGIDFSKAFDKGLMGDIQGMTKDIMDNIGSVERFDKMDFLTRTKIANTLGMTSDELAKSVMLHEKMGQLLPDQAKYLDENLDRMGDISKMGKEQIQERLQQLQSTDRLGVAWEKIKGTFMKALLPLVEVFADAIDAISPILDVIIYGFKGIGMVIKPLVPLIKGMLYPFKLIGDAIEFITSKFEDSESTLTLFNVPLVGISELMGGIGKLVEVIGAGISTWFIGKQVLGGLGLIKTSTMSLGSILPGIGSMFSGVLGSSTKKTEELAKSTVDSTKTISAQSDVTVNAVKTASDAAVKSLTTSTVTATAQVEKAAQKASEAVDVVKQKTKGGLLSGDKAKSAFKFIGAAGAATAAALVTNYAAGFFKVQKEGEESMTNMASASVPILGSMFAIGGTMLSDALSQGIERVFKKTMEKKFEAGLEPILKKGRKGLEKMIDPASNAVEKLGGKTQGVFGKLLSKFGKGGGIMAAVIGGDDVDPLEAMQSQVQDVKKNITESVVKNKTTNVAESIIPDKASEIIPDKPKEVKLPEIPEKQTKTMGDRVKSLKGTLSSAFDTIVESVKSAWKAIKGTLLDITKFIGDVMRTLAKGIGDSIKTILTSIGQGLNSFKGSAIKGAASLLIVSSALWVASKAFQNFSKVSWEDIRKGVVAIGGLTLAAMALGKSSTTMITGAIAIAALGASLIPAAYALNQFNTVEWKSLAKAGVALVGLGLAATALGAISPEILLGAVAIAALGAALIPTAYALNMFNDIGWDSLAKAGVAIIGFGSAAAVFGVISPLILAGAAAIGSASIAMMAFGGSLLIINSGLESLDVSPIVDLTSSLVDLTSISITSLLGLSGAIVGLGTSLATFSTLSAVGNVGTSISKIFGGDVIKDLEKLGNLADPLYIVQNAISGLAGSMAELAGTLTKVDLSELDKLSDFGQTSLDTKVQTKIQPIVRQMEEMPSESTGISDVRVKPQQTQAVKPLPPTRESVAQNVKLGSVGQGKVQTDEFGKELDQLSFNQPNQGSSQQKYSEEDIYNRPNQGNKNLEILMKQAVQLLEAIYMKSSDVVIDSQGLGALHRAMKPFNNGK